ncbi:hypothetical protein EMIT0P265_30668 [Pseudomonas zeae]
MPIAAGGDRPEEAKGTKLFRSNLVDVEREVLPPIMQEQVRDDDKQAGQMAGDCIMLITPPAPTRCHDKPNSNA